MEELTANRDIHSSGTRSSAPSRVTALLSNLSNTLHSYKSVAGCATDLRKLEVFPAFIVIKVLSMFQPTLVSSFLWNANIFWNASAATPYWVFSKATTENNFWFSIPVPTRNPVETQQPWGNRGLKDLFSKVTQTFFKLPFGREDLSSWLDQLMPLGADDSSSRVRVTPFGCDAAAKTNRLIVSAAFPLQRPAHCIFGSCFCQCLFTLWGTWQPVSYTHQAPNASTHRSASLCHLAE